MQTDQTYLKLPIFKRLSYRKREIDAMHLHNTASPCYCELLIVVISKIIAYILAIKHKLYIHLTVGSIIF